MSAKPSASMKLLTIWLNAMTAAWNMGEAPWLYDRGRNVAVRGFCYVLDRTGDLEMAVESVVLKGREEGVDPKRHKWHGKS
jgi:hypothetical protein